MIKCFYSIDLYNQEPFDGTVAFISLPSEIQEKFPTVNNSSPRVQFQFYGIPTLFQTKVTSSYFVGGRCSFYSWSISLLDYFDMLYCEFVSEWHRWEKTEHLRGVCKCD